MTYLQALATQRWDDHRFYHHCRINQTLHLVSAISFLIAYAVLFVDPALAAIIGWCVSMTTRQAGHFFFEPRGYDEVNRVSDAYKERNFHHAQVLPFIDAIDKAYAAAHLVICRAGAMTVAEVSAAGRPAIFIPLPIAGGHQALNVASLCNAGGALCLQQDESLVVKLRQIMQDLITKPERLEKMAHAARQHSMSAGEPSAKIIARIASDLVRAGGS